MALNITPYSVVLDTSVNNCEFNKHLMQGSTDGKFIVTLLKDGVEQTIDSGAKVTMILNYGVQSTCSGTTSTSNFVLAPTDQGYNITISSGKVEIPLSERITDASGINQMVLKIEDGTIAYTYSMLYTVDKNPAYSPQSTPDNLPTYNQIKAQITQLTQTVAGNTNSINTNTGKIATQDSQISTINQEITNLKAKDTEHDSDITTAKQNIAANTNAITTKAEKDLSNVGSFGTAKEGDMFYKKSNNLEVAPINIDDTKREIVSEYSLRVPPNSVHLGENIRMSENGGFVQYDTQTLNKYYTLLDYENNRDTGTQKPIYFERGAKETKFEINSVQNTAMNLSVLNLGTPAFDRQTQAIYLNFVDPVTNLCFKVTVNNKDVGYYPSKNAWDSTTPEEKAKNPGYTKSIGIQKIELEPFWSSLVEYQITLTFKADSTIRVLGDGTKPYYAVDMNRINRKPIALMEDVGGNGGSLALKDLSNVLTLDFEKKFLKTDAYNKIAQYMNTSHSAVIEQANELKPNSNVDLSTTNGSIIFLDYQFQANSQVIRQELPPSSQGKYIMLATVYPNPFTNTQIILSPANGENINGSPSSYTISRSGFLGIAVPTTEGYIWVQSTNLSGETGTTIVNKLELLTGENRLDASAIKNLPSGNGGTETGETIKTKLESLQGENRLDSSAIKNLNNFETFVELTDTPNTYLNNSGKIVAVNSAANALEFKNLNINDIQNFNVSSPSDGQVLMFTGNNWQAETIPSNTINAWPTLAITDDLVIDSTNVSAYNCHILQANGNPTAITIDLPQISTLNNENVSFAFVNAMQSGNILSISGQGGDTFNGAYFMRLYPGDSVKLDKPVSGTKWLITSIAVNEDPIYVEATAPYNFTLAEKNLYLNFTDVSSGNNIAQVLPNTTTIGNNRKVNIYLSDQNINHKVTVSPDTGENIEGLTEFVINSGERVEFISNASEGKWLISSASDRGIIVENGTDIERGVTKLNFPNADFGRNGDTLTIEPKFIADLNGTDTPFNALTNQSPVVMSVDENGKLAVGLNEDIVTFNMSDGSYPKLSHIGVGNGIKLTQDNNNAIFSVANSQYNGFLAVFNRKQVIAETGMQEFRRTTALLPDSVVWQDEDITYNPTTGIINLKYTGTNSEKQLFKIAARATVRRQVRQADLETYLYIADSVTGDYIQDINGETPIINNTIKKELPSGDDIELVTMIEITQDASFKVILKDDTPDKFIEILDIAMGTSAIMVEKVNANNQPSNALASYERLTQQSMRFVKHEYSQSFENAQSLIASTTNANFDVPADTNIQRDGWLIYFQDIGFYKQNTTPDGSGICFEMSDGLAGNGYYSIARVLEYEDTWALRGHEIKAKVDRVEQQGEFAIIPIVWKKRINEYATKIITGMNNQGVYTVTDGWNVIDAGKTVITAPTPAETTASFECSYMVPYDAINVGFILMPTKQQAHSLIKFTDFALGCDPTFERWIIEYPKQAIEEQVRKDNKYIKFVQANTTPYDMSQWYQIPNGTQGDNNFYPIYTGEAQLGGNADITRIYNSASSDFQELHNKGKWRFGKDGRVQVHYKIPIATDKFADGSEHNSFRIAFIKDTAGGNILQGTIIPASLREINIPKNGNIFNDSVRTNGYANLTFTMDVKENDEYWIAVNPINVPRATGNEGHMYSYPSGLIEFTFLENEYVINQLQSNLAEMQKILKATTDAVANKAYVELGWDSGNNKPILEAKTEAP